MRPSEYRSFRSKIKKPKGYTLLVHLFQYWAMKAGPFNTALCFSKLQKSARVLKRLSDITFCINFEIRRLWPTLLKALDISKKLLDCHQELINSRVTWYNARLVL